MSRRRQRSQEDGVFWISYSDLSTALLAVFILAIALMINQHGREQKELLDKVRELQELREQLARRLDGAKDKANEELGKETFGFDPVDQRVYVIDTTWFPPGEHELSDDARTALRVFYPHLHEALFAKSDSGTRPADYLMAIELQGHTDTYWQRVPLWSWENYRENAELSRQRAAAIGTFIGTEFADGEGQTWLEFFGLVETSGRSWTQAYCEDRRLVPADFQKAGHPCPLQTSEDAQKSRRVTFGFRMNDMKLLEEIRLILEAQKAS